LLMAALNLLIEEASWFLHFGLCVCKGHVHGFDRIFACWNSAEANVFLHWLVLHWALGTGRLGCVRVDCFCVSCDMEVCNLACILAISWWRNVLNSSRRVFLNLFFRAVKSMTWNVWVCKWLEVECLSSNEKELEADMWECLMMC